MSNVKTIIAVLTASALILFIIGCGMSAISDVPSEEKFLEISIDSGVDGNRLIVTEEYGVTDLVIVVTDPRGNDISTVKWNIYEGKKTVSIPVSKIGMHTISVTHVSNEDDSMVEVEETGSVMIGPMVITKVTIIPGFVGSMTVDPLETDSLKNIIVLISDGAGYYQVDAASIYQYGATGTQAYESWPITLGMSHYMDGGSYDSALAWSDFDYVKSGATDSAAAATTMSTGTKTYSGAIGKDSMKNDLMHVIDYVEARGGSTGVITSVEWSHATPAAFVAHNVSRGNYAEIATEMIMESSVDVIMGCGHPWYDDNGQLKVTPNTYKYVGGESTWNALTTGTAGGDADGDGMADPWTLVEELADFQALTFGATPTRVCGIAQSYKTLQYNRSGDRYADAYAVPLNTNVPTLETMTAGALNILDENEDGFFLMVEAGAVDWAGHGNASGRVIEEEIDFNKSVEAVIEWIEVNSNWDETLVIVTGDHETGYLTGPGSGNGVWNPIVNNGAGEMPGMEWHSGSHTNQLIPFYSKGVGSGIFSVLATDIDPVRGRYIDNSDIGNVLKLLVQ
jgi:alkaline phosphatase